MSRLGTAVALSLAAGLVAGIIIGRSTRAASPPAPSPVSGWTQLGTPDGTSRTNREPDALDASRTVAGDEARSPAPGVPQPAQVTDAPSVTPPTKGASPDVSTPAPTSGYQSGAKLVAGQASFYCSAAYRSRCTAGVPPDTLAAAAGPALREALGLHWRGRAVTVCGRVDVCVTVTLRDWCACPGRLVDLYASVVRALGLPLSWGVYRVTVSW